MWKSNYSGQDGKLSTCGREMDARVSTKKIIYFFGCAGSLLLGWLFSIVESGSYSPVAVCRLLIVVASLGVEQRL